MRRKSNPIGKRTLLTYHYVTPKPREWKLKDEDTARLFTHEMAAKNDEVTKADDIQKKWLLMKEALLKGSKQVCGE